MKRYRARRRRRFHIHLSFLPPSPPHKRITLTPSRHLCRRQRRHCRQQSFPPIARLRLSRDLMNQFIALFSSPPTKTSSGFGVARGASFSLGETFKSQETEEIFRTLMEVAVSHRIEQGPYWVALTPFFASSLAVYTASLCHQQHTIIISVKALFCYCSTASHPTSTRCGALRTDTGVMSN